MKTKIIMAALIIVATGLIAQPPVGRKDNDKTPAVEVRHGKDCEMGQPGRMKPHGPEIPGLTDEQKARMESLKLELMKAIKPIQNKIREKEAQLQTLRSDDKPDMNKIFSLVDEIGQLKTQARKEHEKHIQAIRQMLDEKQRIMFDTNHSRHPGKPGMKGHDMPGPDFD